MSPLPLAATIDLKGRLPPMQQSGFTPIVIVSLLLLVVAILILIALSARARAEARKKKREEDLRMARKIIARRGGADEDLLRMDRLFELNPRIDPSAATLVADSFREHARPALERLFGNEYAEKMEKLLFPPPKDTNSIAKERNLRKLVEETKTVASTQATSAMIDLMDATLKPGMVVHILFSEMAGGFDCLVMSYGMDSFNITLPSNNAGLLNSIRPGAAVEGSFESGPSLMAFTSAVETVVAGSMPFCRLSIWKNAWEVRKRESVRLGVSLDVDFQHISTASSGAIKMSQLDREISSIRPGRLRDLSLGGCCLDTPLEGSYEVGDFVRFTAALIPGHPRATLLGAIVEVIDIPDPGKNEGMVKRLHMQFLALDDVSQRLLARAMRQLQDIKSRVEWQQAQQMAEQLRQYNLPDAGSAGAEKPAAPQAEYSRTNANPARQAPRRPDSNVQQLRRLNSTVQRQRRPDTTVRPPRGPDAPGSR
ncbi:MAG: PilZ domain-containing protein [Planctomycetota bacterium]|jgi:hypothetical protein|nr:PilZ domain-containing protein [Planctomycetota bacterium]